MLDALKLDTSVSDARADGPPAPSPPTVEDVPCSTEGSWAGTPALYARKAYPGRSMVEIAASVRAILCGASNDPSTDCQTVQMQIADGSASVMCGYKAGASTSWRVRFVLTP